MRLITVMRRTFILSLAVIIACPLFAAKRRAAPGPVLSARSVLWIAAHPDDEIVAAPILRQLCVDAGASCTFLIATRGENGICALPGGCGDLGALRSSEMQASAAAFGAQLIQWTLSDSMEGVAAAWAAAAGGREALAGRIRDVVRSSVADLIVTFDPAHGSSCHPAHREIAALAIEAAGQTAPVLLLETVIERDGAGYVFRSALPGRALTFEAGAGWDSVVNTAEIHASQFTVAEVESLRAMPAAGRRVWLIPATNAPAGGYDVVCE